jgi:hypothetical protein
MGLIEVVEIPRACQDTQESGKEDIDVVLLSLDGLGNPDPECLKNA